MTHELDVERFDFHFPPERIAQAPAEPRDHSRLLYLPARGPRAHVLFRDLGRFMRPGDLLVLNETRVVKARIRAERVHTGGQIELLLLGPLPELPGAYKVLAKPGRRMTAGTILRTGPHFYEVVDSGTVRFPDTLDVAEFCQTYGEVPLPPYITPKPQLDVETAYQPVFARVDGSIAAPTASLHFTNELLAQIQADGVAVAKLLLEVGLGTFAPVRSVNFGDHEIHEEHYSVPLEVAKAIAQTRLVGGRVIAVGTTVVRALETAADGYGGVFEQQGATRKFIVPGYEFQVVDAMVTNFHVPRSTLLALVCAFAGRERVLDAYRDAVLREYRLFSFGDAMFIERGPSG